MRFRKILAIIYLLLISIIMIPTHLDCESRNIDILNKNVINNVFQTSILDFSNFTLIENHTEITSSNSLSDVSFNYTGTSADYPIRETYQLDLSSYGNCTNFYIQLEINYSYLDTTSVGSLSLDLRSNFDEDENSNLDNLLGYVGIWDSSTINYGKFAVAGYPDLIEDVYNTSQGSMTNQGNAIFIANRSNNKLNLTIKNKLDNNLIITNSWYSGISRPLTHFDLNFQTGNLATKVNISCEDIYGEFEIENFIEEDGQNDANSGYDAGDTFETALIISISQFNGSLELQDDNDFYQFYVSSDYHIKATLTGPLNADFDLYLYDPNEQEMDSSLSYSSNEVVEYDSQSSGYWRVRIYRYSGDGSYSCEITTTQIKDPRDDQNDAGTGNDAGDDFYSATPITDETVLGSFTSGDDSDYYSIDLTSYSWIQVTLSGETSTDFDIYVYNPLNEEVDYSASSDSEEALDITINHNGNWRIQVLRYSGYGNYSLSIQLYTENPTAQNNGFYKIGIIVGIAITAFLILGIVFFVIRTRKQKLNNEQAESISTQERPKDETLFQEDHLEPFYKTDPDLTNEEKEAVEDFYSSYTFSFDEEEDVSIYYEENEKKKKKKK